MHITQYCDVQLASSACTKLDVNLIIIQLFSANRSLDSGDILQQCATTGVKVDRDWQLVQKPVMARSKLKVTQTG